MLKSPFLGLSQTAAHHFDELNVLVIFTTDLFKHNIRFFNDELVT